MGATARIFILGLCCFVFVVYYYLVNIMVLVSERCWKQSEFWFEDSYWLSPYWCFFAFFTLAFLWLVAEIHSLLASRTKVLVKASMLSVTFIVVVMSGIMHFSLWQSLEILDGKRAVDEFWPKLRGFERPDYPNKDDDFFHLHWREQDWISDREWLSKNQNGHPLGWNAFVWEKTCLRGIEAGRVSEEQWAAWVNEHNEMIKRFYAEKDKNLVRKNLVKTYALPSEPDTSLKHP